MFLKNKQSSLVAVILIILSLGLAVIPTMSVNGSSTNPTTVGMIKKIYHPKHGDNLWDVSGKLLGNPNRWRELAEWNNLTSLVFKGPKGPYDKPQEYCPLDTSLELVYYVPEVDAAKADTAGAIPFVPPAPLDYGSGDEIAKWFWIIIGVLVGLFILYKIFSARRKNKESDPVGSGAPQVIGGVDPERALQRAQNIANANGMNPLRVTNIQRGRFYGRGKVFYADKPLGLMKRFNGEYGYRGIVLRANGEEQTVYFLQGCGNDVSVGNFMTGIRFVADDDQPKTFITHNQNQISIQEQEGVDQVSTGEESEKTLHSFNAQQKVLEIAEKIITEKQEAFLEFTVGSIKIKLDTLNKDSGNSSRKNQLPKNERDKSS